MEKINFNYSIKDAKDFVDQLKKEPSLQGVDINDDNASLYFQQVNSQKNCLNCKGLEYCKNITRGYFKFVDNESKTLKIEACKFKKLEEKQKRAYSFVKTMYMPESVLKCDLENFELSNPSRKTAHRLASNFIANVKTTKTGLYLFGTFGVGKTYLLACIANELAKKDVSCMLVYFPDLVRGIKSNMGNNKFEDIINKLKTVDVLMLDDFGSENLTPWLRDEIIGPILNYRYMDHLPICISSNFNFEELFDHLSETVAQGNDSSKGDRMIKRIVSLANDAVELKK